MLQTRLWQTQPLELTHRETGTKRTVPSMVLPLDNATPEQRHAMLGVLNDKYGLTAREARSAALQGKPVIRVDDRTSDKDAGKLIVLLHLTDPANWRKSSVKGWADGPDIPILSYRMPSLEDGRIAAGLLDKQGVEYQPAVVMNPDVSFRLQVTGASPVRQLLGRLPALYRDIGKIAREEPDGGASGGPNYSDWVRQWQQSLYNRSQEPASKPEQPDEAGRIHARERSMRAMEAALHADEAARRGAREELQQTFQRHLEADRQVLRDEILKPSVLHKKVVRFFADLLTPYEELREAERQRAYLDREKRGPLLSDYAANTKLCSEDQSELNRIARAKHDASQDREIRRERQKPDVKSAFKDRMDALRESQKLHMPSDADREATKLAQKTSRGMSM